MFIFFLQVEEVLGDEPDIKEQLFGVLKQYAAERNVENLAEALPDILINEDHQQLIDSVRYQSADYNTLSCCLFVALGHGRVRQGPGFPISLQIFEQCIVPKTAKVVTCVSRNTT